MTNDQAELEPWAKEFYGSFLFSQAEEVFVKYRMYMFDFLISPSIVKLSQKDTMYSHESIASLDTMSTNRFDEREELHR